jgi:mannose-6-phosphate isomerase-like protein (cupin superfamily)
MHMQIARYRSSNESHSHAARPAALATPARTSVPEVQVRTIDAGTSIEPHVHHDTDEFVYVLDGCLSVRLGEREATLRAGMSAALRQGLRHGFANVGDRPARMLVVLGGHGARFLDALAEAHANLPQEAAEVAAALVEREMYVLT